MRSHHRRLFLIPLAVILTIGLFATSAVARPGLGSAESPIMLSVVDGVNTDAVEQMATALEIATGLHFEVEPVEYGQAGVDWLCEEVPDRGMRIMPPTEYVVAKGDCGAETSMTLRRFGRDATRGMFLVPKDSGLSSLADLADLNWYYSDEGSTTGYLLQLHMLNEAGVDGYIPNWAGSHSLAVKAVYDNAVDQTSAEPVFATVFDDARRSFWNQYGDQYPPGSADVFDVVEVLELTPFIPFDATAFGPRFPDGLRNQIEDLLKGFTYETHPAHWVWADSFGSAYSSDGWVKATWKDFHFLRDAMADTGYDF